MRISNIEKNAIKKALEDFNGEIYLFGSRLNDNKKGGDIDILLIPKKDENHLKLSIKIQKNFFMLCEQTIDVLIYKNNLFFKEILKDAKKINLERI